MRFFLILFIIQLLFASTIQAQKKNAKLDSVLVYSIISNNPKNAEKLTINIVPLKVDLYFPNSSLDVKLSAEYNLDNVVSVGIAYDLAYTDRWNEPFLSYTSYKATSLNVSKPKTSIDFFGEILFNRKIVKETYSFSMNPRSVVVLYTDIAGKAYKYNSIRFSYQYFQSYVGDVNVFTGDEVGFSYRGISEIAGGTMLYGNIILFGISRTKRNYIDLDFVKYGRKYYKSKNQIYFDILYAPEMQFENMILYEDVAFDAYGNIISIGNNSSQYEYTKTYLEYTVDKYTKKSPFGFRMGYMTNHIKSFGGVIGFEIGCRPGPFSLLSNLYIQASIGASISSFK